MKAFKNKRISKWDIALFFRQFAALIHAGIPIINACTILEADQHSALRTLINRIKYNLLSGKPLSTCLRSHPQYFDELIYQLVLISEHTGKLDTVLQMIAKHLEQQLLFREKIRRAMFYPCTVAIIGIIITLMMIIFIVPRFAVLFHDLPGELPFISQVIFQFSALASRILWLPPILAAIAYYVLRKKQVSVFNKLPVIKNLWRQIHITRFARQLGITLNAGIPITSAINLAQPPHHDPLFTNSIHQLSRLVRSGVPLYRAMQSFDIFPSMLTQMVQTGEEAGRLDDMLIHAANLLDADLKRLFDRLSQLLEPLIIVVLGVLIGGLVIGMYLPIFKLGNII